MKIRSLILLLLWLSASQSVKQTLNYRLQMMAHNEELFGRIKQLAADCSLELLPANHLGHAVQFVKDGKIKASLTVSDTSSMWNIDKFVRLVKTKSGCLDVLFDLENTDI